MAIFAEKIDPRAMLESHWHTNAYEFNYCVPGMVQIGIVAPDGSSHPFVVEPGIVADIPET